MPHQCDALRIHFRLGDEHLVRMIDAVLEHLAIEGQRIASVANEIRQHDGVTGERKHMSMSEHQAL